MIQLGDRVRDRLTGFNGIVIATTEWLYNCRRITVQPSDLDKDGAVAKTESFDEDQLEVIEAGAFVAKLPVTPLAVAEVSMTVEEAPEPLAKTGGPRDTPSRRADPQR